MSALKKMEVKEGELEEVLENLAEVSRNLAVTPNERIVFTVQVVSVPDDAGVGMGGTVTAEQQRLLDKFMNIVPSTGSGNSTEILRQQRDEASGFSRDNTEK